MLDDINDLANKYIVHHRKRKPDLHYKTTDRIRRLLVKIGKEEKSTIVAESLLNVVGELEFDNSHSFVTLFECVMSAAEDYGQVEPDEITGEKSKRPKRDMGDTLVKLRKIELKKADIKNEMLRMLGEFIRASVEEHDLRLKAENIIKQREGKTFEQIEAEKRALVLHDQKVETDKWLAACQANPKGHNPPPKHIIDAIAMAKNPPVENVPKALPAPDAFAPLPKVQPQAEEAEEAVDEADELPLSARVGPPPAEVN